MHAQRAPRQIDAPDAAPSVDARRQLYAQAMRASKHPNSPEGQVALVLLEVVPAKAATDGEELLAAATSRLAGLLNRRLRSIDMLVRSASSELAVLLSCAHIGVAAAFSERLRQPIEQALRGMGLADRLMVCMGLAANPTAFPWHPDALIELADFRMREAMRHARAAKTREWALVVECAAVPANWSDAIAWPSTSRATNDSGF